MNFNFSIFNEDGLQVGRFRKSYLVKFVDPEKEYDVDYLAPHQSKTGERESGFFKIKGIDLTENQIFQLFLKEAL